MGAVAECGHSGFDWGSKTRFGQDTIVTRVWSPVAGSDRTGLVAGTLIGAEVKLRPAVSRIR